MHIPKYHYKQIPPSLSIGKLVNAVADASYSFSGRIMPSGAVSVGSVPRKKILSDSLTYERNRSKGVYYLRCSYTYPDGYVKEPMYREEQPEELGLSIVQNCRSEDKKRYGLRGISAAGRSRVYEGAYLLQRRYGRRLGFYTLTCPFTDVRDIYLYNQNISYILRSYFEELKRVYNRLEIPFSYVAVLEYQDGRYQESGIPALHIHYVLPCYRPDRREFVLTADDLRSLWGRVVARVVCADVSVASSIDAQVVKTSASHYLAKYLGKGGATVEYLSTTCPDQVPGRWWSMSRNLRECIKKNTIVLSDALCRVFMYESQTFAERGIEFVFFTPVYACIRSVDTQVGVYGVLKATSGIGKFVSDSVALGLEGI